MKKDFTDSSDSIDHQLQRSAPVQEVNTSCKPPYRMLLETSEKGLPTKTLRLSLYEGIIFSQVTKSTARTKRKDFDFVVVFHEKKV